jgi:hypothetical protein
VTSQEKRPSINDAPADVPRLPLVPPGEPAAPTRRHRIFPGPIQTLPFRSGADTGAGGPEDEPQPPDAPTALP